MTKLLLLIALAMTSHFAHADTMRNVLYEAIKNGSAETIVDSSIAKVFNLVTKSDHPLHMKLTRLRKFAGDCAEVRVEFNQQGIRTPDGKPVLTSDNQPAAIGLKFNLPICLDGSLPHESIDEEKERRARMLNVCSVKIEKGKKGGEIATGKIIFAGCPSSGNVKITYEGSCTQLSMQAGTFVQFSFDNTGHLEVPLQIPTKCIQQANAISKWNMYLYENNPATTVLIGIVSRLW